MGIVPADVRSIEEMCRIRTVLTFCIYRTATARGFIVRTAHMANAWCSMPCVGRFFYVTRTSPPHLLPLSTFNMSSSANDAVASETSLQDVYMTDIPFPVMFSSAMKTDH